MSHKILEDPNTLEPGVIRKDNKNNHWVVVSTLSGKRWTLYKTKREKEKKYQTHFNMSRPYKIRMTQRKILIYPRERPSWYPQFKNDNETLSHSSHQLHSNIGFRYIPSYKKVFVGQGVYKYDSIENKMNCIITEDSIGNSIFILLNQKDNLYEYLWIGHHILSFTLHEPIIKFNSPLIGADVPYPSAESRDKIYLIDEKDNYMIQKELVWTEDVYKWLYSLTNKDKSLLDRYDITRL